MSNSSTSNGAIALLIIFVFTLFNPGFANTKADKLAMDFVRSILENEKNGNISKSIEYSKYFNFWLNKQEPALVKKFKEPNFNRLIMLYSRIGDYEAAIDTLNSKKAWDASSVKKSNYIALKTKMKNRDKLYELRKVCLQNDIKKEKEMIVILKNKNSLIKQFNLTNKANSKDLDRLKGQIKQCNSKLAKLYKEKKAYDKEFIAKFKSIASKGVMLTVQMSSNLTKLSEQSDRLIIETLALYKKSKSGYLEVSKKFKIGCVKLKETIDKMIKAQSTEIKLHTELKNLMKKKKLSNEEKKTFLELKRKLIKQSHISTALKNSLEKSFANSENFIGLSADDSKEYKKVFAELKKRDAILKKHTDLIEKYVSKIDFPYGDVNSDGKIDYKDYVILNRYVNNFHGSVLYKDAAKRIDLGSADLDGDGRVTLADFKLMQEKIYGTRKTFPVDPKNKVGDMNGDGSVNSGDLDLMQEVLKNSGNVLASWKRIADINGDGNIDKDDRSGFANLWKKDIDMKAKAKENKAEDSNTESEVKKPNAEQVTERTWTPETSTTNQEEVHQERSPFDVGM